MSGGSGTHGGRRLETALAVARAVPERTALITDYDGTLAPIVLDPRRAVPVAGGPEVLHKLARRFGVVAVVSGRPASFLREQLAVAENRSGLVAFGLYGMEHMQADGQIAVSEEALSWRPIVVDTEKLARQQAPAEVTVEGKGLSVTLHWRAAKNPQAAQEWAESFARRVAGKGLKPSPGKMSLELRPPVGVDKGEVVRTLCSNMDVCVYLGDDQGDLAAFDALDQLSLEGPAPFTSYKVAVSSHEVPPELVERADVVVASPEEALNVLRGLLAA